MSSKESGVVNLIIRPYFDVLSHLFITSTDTIAIKKVLSPTCQILFFSATYSQDIISFSERLITKAHLVTLSSDEDLILAVVFQVTPPSCIL